MYRLKQLILLIIDLLLLFFGLYLATTIRAWELPGRNLLALIAPMSQLFILALIINFIVGLYDLGRIKKGWNYYQKIAIAGTIWIGVGVLYFYARPQIFVAPKTILVLTALCGFNLIAVWRIIYSQYVSRALWKTKVIFAGLTPEVIELIRHLTGTPELGYQINGIVLSPADVLPVELSMLPSGNSLKTLNTNNFDTIVIAPHMAANANLLKELYSQLFKQISFYDLAKFYEYIFKRVPPFTFSEAWFLTNLREQQKKIYDRFRILTDYLITIIVGLFFIITFPFISLFIKLTSRGPLFFKQERVGKLGKKFYIYKYRTMKSLTDDGSAELDGPQFAQVNDTRITAVGKFLRKTRLDEIPQFINIIKGQMSLIGPRPERPEFVAQLTAQMPFYTLRHLVKPGLTGWAQIHQSYYGTIQENLHKLEYDLYYIKNRGLLIDLVITLRTLNIIGSFAGR